LVVAVGVIAIVPMSGESKSDYCRLAPEQPLPALDYNRLMTTGGAFGFGLEPGDCFVPAAVLLFVFEMPANCCSVAENDSGPETRLASGVGLETRVVSGAESESRAASGDCFCLRR
jgi:hypothetical protein